MEIYTGADDRIMRRMVVGLKRSTSRPTRATRRSTKLDMQFQDVNEDQEIEAPDDARPFSELAAQLQGLGIGLDQLGGGGASSGGSSGSGATQQSLDDYAKCIQDAGGDSAQRRKCSEALATP